jgi:hypothetical protein
MPKRVQAAYTAILRHLIDFGRAPHYIELAGLIGVDVEEARKLQVEAAEAAEGAQCWLVPDTDLIEAWAPFSNLPTHFRVSVDDRSGWYGLCGLEVLAARWLFPGQEVRVDSLCPDCGEAVTLRMRDDDLLIVDPPAAVGYMPSPFSRSRVGSAAFN